MQNNPFALHSVVILNLAILAVCLSGLVPFQALATQFTLFTSLVNILFFIYHWKFEQLNNFPEYKFNIKDKNESTNSEMIYSSNDYGEFNKIIETNNKEEKTTEDKNKKVKVIDYGKLKEGEKKIKNKLGIEKIKIVYFD